jgi:hypothetical protein
MDQEPGTLLDTVAVQKIPQMRQEILEWLSWKIREKKLTEYQSSFSLARVWIK